MTASHFTYQRLVELVDDDHDLIAYLVDEGVIETRDDDRAQVHLDSVLAARSLRELEVDWSGIPIILRLVEELGAARRRIAELEAAASDDALPSTRDR